MKKAALIRTVTNVSNSPLKTKFDGSVDIMSKNPINNLSEIQSGTASPSPNLKSRFELNEDKIMELEVQNHITDNSIRE